MTKNTASGLYLVVMEWTATISGDRVGYLRFWGFFSGEKNFGELFSAWRKWKLQLFYICCNSFFGKFNIGKKTRLRAKFHLIVQRLLIRVQLPLLPPGPNVIKLFTSLIYGYS